MQRAIAASHRARSSDEGYSVGSRFVGDKGTHSEELIAAAQAACFSMASSLLLSKTGMNPESIETNATITLDKMGEGFEITASHLDVRARAFRVRIRRSFWKWRSRPSKVALCQRC